MRENSFDTLFPLLIGKLIEGLGGSNASSCVIYQDVDRSNLLANPIEEALCGIVVGYIAHHGNNAP